MTRREVPSLSPNQGDAKKATVLRLISTEAEDGGRLSGRLRPSGVPCLLLVKAEPGGPGTPKSRLPFQILETSAHFAREQGVCTATACKTRPMGTVEGVGRGRTTCGRFPPRGEWAGHSG